MNKLKNRIIHGGSLTELRKISSGSVDCVMTSPPYWALRDYGSEVETIWGGNKGCKHEWESSEITKINRMIGLNERHQKEKGNTKSKFVKEWNRPSRREYSNRKAFSICPVCKKEFEGKPEQKFCSVKCLNTLSNEQRISTPQVSNFCRKCGAWKGQLGLEPTFDLYIEHLCDIFDEVKRVLKDEGTCWVNLGDTYGGSHCGYGQSRESSGFQNVTRQTYYATSKNKPLPAKIMPKSLIMIPFRFAIEMANRGWILRNTIIWHKPNCMPSSVKDRFTVDFEYLFFFVKNKKYWFEKQYEPLKSSSLLRANYSSYSLKTDKGIHGGMNLKSQLKLFEKIKDGELPGRNKRCVWRIATRSFSEAHFAVYPEDLCEIPIKAGCPEFICRKCGKAREKIFKGKRSSAFNLRVRDAKKGKIKYKDRKTSAKEINNYEEKTYGGNGRKIVGYTDCGCKAGFEPGIVLDPFFGAGTTGLVALKQNKNFIGIELNPEYIKIAKARIKPFMK